MPRANSQQPLATQTEKVGINKILIVTYYWPPSGGSGVQRWLKFVKYLPGFGWHPFVFTPENPSFEIRDDTLEKDIPSEAEVLRFPIWEPYRAFNRLSQISGKKAVKQTDRITTGKKTLFQSITSWIRGNLFIPDPRVYWVKPSVRFLTDVLKSNGIRTVVTTGPPHSMHLIGLKLKEKDPSLTWIADLRDPWSEWDLLDALSLSSWARRKHQRLERNVLSRADRVITIAPYHVKRFEALGKRKVDLITNGFDPDDFKSIQKTRTKQFTIRHIGMVDELRDPRPFMEAVKVVAAASREFLDQTRIEFIGSVNSAFREYVSADSTLARLTVFSEPMPHSDLVKLYGETDVELLVLAHTMLAPGNLPGKLFEYLASGNFVFGVGPEAGDSAEILRQTHAGVMIERTKHQEIKDTLLDRFNQWKRGSEQVNREVSGYSRKELTRKLVQLISS